MYAAEYPFKNNGAGKSAPLSCLDISLSSVFRKLSKFIALKVNHAVLNILRG
jgi:hypothetical protein